MQTNSMLKSVLLGFGLCAVAGSSLAHDGGRIGFSGAITTATCKVQSSLPASQTLVLPQAGSAGQAGNAGFAIQFSNCYSSITKVNTYLESADRLNPTSNNVMLQSEAGDKGAELQLFDDKQQKLQVAQVSNIDAGRIANMHEGRARLEYFAALLQPGAQPQAATAGQANMVMTMVYQ